jgi:hypothetical protein
MVKHMLTVALVKSVLQVMDRMVPTRHHRHQQHSRHRGRGRNGHRRPVLGGTLDLDRLYRTGGDPGRDHHVKHRSRSLILGLGLCNDYCLPLPHHRPIGRWNPQTRPPLCGVAGNRPTPSTVWARARTRLR